MNLQQSPLRRPFTFRMAALCVALLGSGCVTKGNFPNRGAGAWCDKLEECHGRAAIDGLFGSLNGCYDSVEESLEKTIEDCKDWDGKVARECIRDTEEASCTSITLGRTPCSELLEICG